MKRKRQTGSDPKDDDDAGKPTAKKHKFPAIPYALQGEASTLKARIERELRTSSTNPAWPGHGKETDAALATDKKVLYRLSAGPVVKQAVQKMGEIHGCHTCLTLVATDRDQPWHGDHNPPTNLKPAGLGVFQNTYDRLDNDETYLFPQCHTCSNKQASIVKKINQLRNTSKIEPYLEKMQEDDFFTVTGRLEPKTDGANYNCIIATGSRVKPGEGITIQSLGGRQGCHSCQTKFPCKGYHADHVFPKELATHWAEELFKKLEIPFPAKFYYRPQCPKCSGAQGGDMSALTRDAIAFAGKAGITVYK